MEKGGIRALNELYVRFHREAEEHPEYDDEARAYFKKIEEKDEECLALFRWFKELTLKDVQKIYDLLDVHFDSYAGESFYSDKMGPVVEELKEKGLLVESQGAQVVDLEAYGMPPCIILKSDGTSLYATRDMAAAIYRKKTYDFYKCLYVVAYQQNLHFKQFFKVLELMGKEWAKDLVHVQFGMVSYEGQPLSTRKGHVVFLADVIENTVEKARKIIEDKNPGLPDKDRVAESVGVGAVMFFALGTQRIKDVDFDYDKVLSFEGETAPYLQYTHARCRSVLSKGGERGREIDFSLLTDDDAYAVVTLLSRFNDTVRDAAEKYEPSVIARYLIDLAQKYNRFYIADRIVTEDKALSAARLALTEKVADTIKTGLGLLLTEAPDRM